MKQFLLYRVPLTGYLFFLIVLFTVISFFTESIELNRATLTLFSVNSFLYGFYISPIIKGQRDRIDTLHKLVRVEASKLYEIAQYSARLEPKQHRRYMDLLTMYAQAAYVDHDVQGEQAFENLMAELVKYDGNEKDPYKEMLKQSFYIQQTRTEIDRLLSAKVYRNEWIVMTILFSITITFILMIQVPEGSILQVVPPILCAGLSMLTVILIKMSTLAHKRAHSVWDPLQTVVGTRFLKINKGSVND